MKGGMYKYIYCHVGNFTQNDLEKFPTLNFINKDLRFSFSLNYKDLFYLTEDKNYYIFNIMIINIYNPYDYEDIGGLKWVLGIPFWKKYQFSFDSDNKLIYFYNKNGKFLDEISPEDNTYNEDKKEDADTDNINNKKNENNLNLPMDNNQNNDNKNISIEINTIFLFGFLIIIFIVLFCILILIIRKLLFKKGFILIRTKKANELNDDEYYNYSSQNINYSKKDNLKNKECEMQIQKFN